MNQITKARPGDSSARGSTETASYQPPYLAAGIATLAVFALYAITLSPTTWFWDTSEYIATAHIMGIPHPPGNPLFVVLARAWELLLAPTGLSVAVRINLFSAVMSALAHGLWFLVAHRVLSYFSSDRLFRLIGAGAATLIGATAFTVWNQSNVNEKVYTVSLFTIALLTWLAFLWRDNLGEGKDDNLILLMVFILALSVGNHLMAFLAAPALLIFIVLVEPRTLLNWRLYAGAAVVAVLGLSIHLFLPLRAKLGPVINEADPSTWTALLESLARKQYDKPSILLNPIDRQTPRDISLLMAQIGNYLYYFDWQWARAVAGLQTVFGGARPIFTALFALLGLGGAWTHYKRDRTSWAYIATLFATLSLGLIFYLNFKFGYSWGSDEQIPMAWREVRERDYFFIVSFSLWGVWAGIGLAALWQFCANWIADQKEIRPGRGLALTAPILAIALIPLTLNWSWANRSNDYSARDWAYNLLQSVEPYGVLFTNGDNDTFPLWYLQEVEGIRRDVTVMVMSYLNTPWYVKQIRQLTTPCPEGVSATDDDTRIICQRAFLPDQAPAFYSTGSTVSSDQPGTPLDLDRPTQVRAPTRSIIPSTDEEIDELMDTYNLSPGSFFIREPARLDMGDFEVVIPPQQFLTPADYFVLQIVQNSIEDRPIYFASTTQAYENVGLTPFLIRQGLALKLNNGPVEPDPEAGIFKMPDELAFFGEYVDLPRTDSLLWNVFIHRGGLPDRWNHWVDVATQGFPNYYGYTHLIAEQLHLEQGNIAAASRHRDRLEAWLTLGRK